MALQSETAALDLIQLLRVMDVLKRCSFPDSRWFELGLRLGLLKTTLDAIEERYFGNDDRCLTECLSKWLSKADNVVSRGGPPTLDSLSVALFAMNETAVADKLDREDCNVQAIAILSTHYPSLSQSLIDPVGVARLLHKEHVISGAVLANVESTLSDRRKVLLAAVRQAVNTKHQFLYKFGTVLCKVTGNIQLGEDIVNDYDAKNFPESQLQVEEIDVVPQSNTTPENNSEKKILQRKNKLLTEDEVKYLQSELQRYRSRSLSMPKLHAVSQVPLTHSSQPDTEGKTTALQSCHRLSASCENLIELRSLQRYEDIPSADGKKRWRQSLPVHVAASQMKKKGIFTTKLILIGDCGVGKTNLLFRFTEDRFTRDTPATIGTGYAMKMFKINGNIIQARIWDTAGQERYQSLITMYYRGAAGALVVYDITDRSSYENIKTQWLREIREHFFANDIVMMLIGNKCDLKKSRQVTTKEAKRFAEEHSMDFMETSASDSTNVEPAFQTIITEIYDKGLLTNSDWDASNKEHVITLGNENENIPMMKKKQRCCGKKGN